MVYKHLPRQYDYAYRGHTHSDLDWGRCGEVLYASRSLAVAKDFARGGHGAMLILAFDGDVAGEAQARLGVLMGSTLSLLLGLIAFRLLPPPKT